MIKFTVNNLSTEQASVTTQVTSLQSSVNSLMTTSVNPFQSCIEETSSCTESQSGSTYWKHCSTPALPINKTVSFEYLSTKLMLIRDMMHTHTKGVSREGCLITGKR